MFERFTDRARRVVVLAQEEARMLSHNYIGTEHILLGLIHEGEGVAAKALESLDISLEAVRAQVEEIIGQGQQAPSGHIPFTPRAKKVLELSLRELFEYRLMQTDPNWTNFLYNERTGKIELIDFGAARAYDKPFIDDWLCMLRAAIGGRRDECVAWSEKVGYLTGQESEVSTRLTAIAMFC